MTPTPYWMKTSKRRAEDVSDGAISRPYADVWLARAYLSLLEAVEPLLAAADEACLYMDTHIADRVPLAEAAAALRDLLGPTGGQP